jgi:tetratricopeptide (TPR) repeat protein
MAGLSDFQIPAPAKWEDFEDLCLDLWRKIWRDDNAQKNGRRGQPQHGVDVFGRPGPGTQWSGVQCKGKNEALGSILTEEELLAEVEKAKKFTPPISEFTVASTGPRDGVLQRRARSITDANESEGLFSVHVWCWVDILERLNEFPEVIQIHFPYFQPIQTFSTRPAKQRTLETIISAPHPGADASVLVAFAAPGFNNRMLERARLIDTMETAIAEGRSIYLTAPSGYGKSVAVSQIRSPNTFWIDCEKDYRDYTQFQDHLSRLLRFKYPGAILPDRPRELARALDQVVVNSGDAPLVLVIDHVDSIDAGVKAVIEELLGGAQSVRLIVSGSTFHLRRARSLEHGGRIRVITADDLAFDESETVSVVTAPLGKTDATPTAEFGSFVHAITKGWPIAVQLIRARLERAGDESVVSLSLGDLAQKELGAYLLESYWYTLHESFRDLLLATSLYKLFDYSDALALVPHQKLDLEWQELTALPFVTHLPDSFIEYHVLFRDFLRERLSREHTAIQLRQMHHAAALHFIEGKDVAPAAHYHAQQSGDQLLVRRAAGAMAEYCFFSGDYPMMKRTLDSVPVDERWDDPTLGVYQGRLYERFHEWANALKWYRRAKELFDAQGPDFWRIGIVNDIGGILRKTGEFSEAVSLYEAALSNPAVGPMSAERARLMANEANVLLEQHQLEQAENLYAEAMEIFAIHGDMRGRGLLYNSMAALALSQKRPAKALGLRLKALQCLRAARAADLFADVAVSASNDLFQRSKYRLAHRICKEALRMSMDSSVLETMPTLLNNFASSGESVGR